MQVENPILRGFHPDPSIVRVGEDYYIATSTFEWWPGVRLHHSRDLIHWELMPYPLNRVSQLDLRGIGPSQGIWAPCLTYDDGMFYLVYTVVSAFYCNMYDTANYLVTARDINGPWSEPVALNHFGFDPSLFHDEDGRKYMVSMVTDHRVPKKYKGRLVLQEYDPASRQMVGEVREIFRADRIFLEGPHIFKRNGSYYLFCADTGTGEGHGQTILRSEQVWGPYEMYIPGYDHSLNVTGNNLPVHPVGEEACSILTTRYDPDYPIQKAGHCDLVETKEGQWYAVYLCGRPLENRNGQDALRFPGERRYPLGRETAITRMEWREDGWLQLANGTDLPDLLTEVPDPEGEMEAESPTHSRLAEDDACAGLVGVPAAYGTRDHFDRITLDLDYQSLRVPMDETHISLEARPRYLRMYGREGLASRFHQSLIAKRITEFDYCVMACLEFEPEVFKQMAGLICMYDEQNYFYLHLTCDEDIQAGSGEPPSLSSGGSGKSPSPSFGGKCISILAAENKQYTYPVGVCPVKEGCPVYLKAEIHRDKLQFFYGYEETEWIKIGPVLDFSILSDEACTEGWFTGAMAGICCQDLTGFGKYADFDWFECRVLPAEEDEN